MSIYLAFAGAINDTSERILAGFKLLIAQDHGVCGVTQAYD
jgi:hypothetical protein